MDQPDLLAEAGLDGAEGDAPPEAETGSAEDPVPMGDASPEEPKTPTRKTSSS